MFLCRLDIAACRSLSLGGGGLCHFFVGVYPFISCISESILEAFVVGGAESGVGGVMPVLKERIGVGILLQVFVAVTSG